MSEQEDNQFENLLYYLQQNRGFDFTGYKRPSLMRRVRRRMQIVGVDSFVDYLDYLEVHPEEFSQLFNTILINVTSFYRDPAAWGYLGKEIIHRILQKKQPDESIRVWSAGCASGEEAYTAAMVLSEAMGIEIFRRKVKIYATDVDEEALNIARQASYAAKDLEEIDSNLRSKYFEPLNDRYIFRVDLRRSVIFGRHDLVQDAPISKLDLLICRNTLMYFNSETQARILARFHFALNDNGYLFLGRAELLLTHSNLFTPMDLRFRIFSKVQHVNTRDSLLAMAQTGNHEMNNIIARRERLQELAIEKSITAEIVVDMNSNVAHINQKARLFFSLNLKDIGRPLRDLEISYRPVELRSLIEQAYSERRSVTLTNVERRFQSGEVQYLDVVVTPVYDETNNPLGVSISFPDLTAYHSLQEDLQRSREEIQTTNEELQSSNEELETTNEELQSSNEELETTNEELQSTNEELETMNEELQSTNEEIQTVNDELRERTEELNHINAFLESVVNSLTTGAVVLDHNLNILMWNYKVEDLWGVRDDEVKGQSLMSLDIGLPLDQLPAIIRPCLSGEADRKEISLSATNRRGKAFICRVSCSPLMTHDKKRQGVILLMEEERTLD